MLLLAKRVSDAGCFCMEFYKSFPLSLSMYKAFDIRMKFPISSVQTSSAAQNGLQSGKQRD